MPGLFENPYVEEYFRRVNAPLKSLPAPERAEVHQELRQHLDALVSAHMELGATEDEAIHAALRSFGDPAKIGQRMAWEWARARPLPVSRTHFEMMPAFVLLMLVSEFVCGTTLLSNELWLNGALCAVPVWAGMRAGRRLPEHKAVRETGKAALVFAAPLLVLSLLSGVLYHVSMPVAGGLVPLACWLPLGCLSARLSARRQAKQRQ